MLALSVLVSHSGKTVELEVGPNVRVEAVQQTLADLTGIALTDQILMCEGSRLDAAKPLSAYDLPGEAHSKVHDLFLYSRAHLRPDTPAPPTEELPECQLDFSGLEGIRAQRHRLDAAGSPLLRALPDYQRQFHEHLLQGNARHEASQQRMATCARLVSEQEVQALSIDAATSNVEVHYAYICDAYGAFMARYRQQAAAHADVLGRFESDLQYLASTELHPALRLAAGGGASPSTSTTASSMQEPQPQQAQQAQQQPSSSSSQQQQAQPANLSHLVDSAALREAAAAAARGHQHFSGKVAELEALYGMLRGDVEALFMQAPSVDLEALTRELEEMHGQVDEQASIVAALASDLNKVQQLVEQASEQLAADPVASVQVSDTVHMLETMHETHVGHLLPRVAACHTAVEAFAARCLDCKNALTRDVYTQLRTISSQQSKIREMKNKLALFREALARQEAAVQELLVVRRVPAAYKQCLAECVRREAFMEKYAHSAAALAERMGAFREKELNMRESFRKHVERLIPSTLLERMGLLEQPPHCQVSVSATEGERLLAVTVDDIRRIQLPWGAASILAVAQQQQQQAAGAQQQQQQHPGTPTGGSGSSSREGSAMQSGRSAAEQQQQQTEAAAAAAAAEPDVTAVLQLENAKLRSELASAIALDCIRAAQLATVASVGAAAVAAAAQQSAAGGSGQASPQLGQSALTTPRGAAVPGAAAAASGAAAVLPPDAAQRFERALAAKDSLVSELQSQLGASRQQAALYEARIRSLESQFTQLAAAADGRTAPPAETAAAAGAPAAAPQQGTGSQDDAVSAAHAQESIGSPTALSTSPGSEARRQAASDLSASVDAAGGSSLSGPLQAPDTSRCLGASTSLALSAAAPPLRPAAKQEEEQPAAEVAHSAAAGEEQSGPSMAPLELAPSAAAGAAPLGASTGCASSTHDVAAAAAGEDSSATATEQIGQPAAEAATVDSTPAAEEAAEREEPVAEEAAGEDEAQAEEAAGSEEPAAEEAAAEEPPAAAPAEPPPPPHPLLSSLMEGEGSDVEGVEPVSDSDDESEAEEAGQEEGSPRGGYGSAHSGAGSEAGGEQREGEADLHVLADAAGEGVQG